MTKLEKEVLLKPEQIDKLKELFPQAVAEGKVDFVLLKALLGEQVEETNEKYQFTWNGKQNAIAHAQKPSSGTLREDKASSKNFDSTDNLYIEGDNLEVLKLLQKTYQGKIKMIYIDPPYNTGNDFVYKDDFKDNIKNYLELTNQKNKSNAETSGRYHTDWLNMMYPRLMLARNLLTDDGVIFISIDDNEQSNLKKMCDEIFGEGNFITNIIWQRAFSPKNDNKHISKSHDFIVVYSKQIINLVSNGLLRDAANLDRYSNPDNDPRGSWQSSTMTVSNGTKDYYYELITPFGRKLYPPEGRFWVYTINKYNLLLKENRIWFGLNGDGVPRIKTFLSEVSPTTNPMSIWLSSEVGHSQGATQDLKVLFNEKKYFEYPKPLNLILRILKLYTKYDSLILDFFSGSGTTAHAVMKLNAEDGGKRKFIMVQLPEKTEEDSEAYKAGYQNICEIGKERIRRAAEKVKQEMLEKDSSSDVSKIDVGFKVFKLDSTNIKPWDGTQDINQMLVEASGNVVKKDRTDLDVVHELMLMYGVFNEEVEEIKINGKTLYSIGEHFLVVCLFKSIIKQDIETIIKLKPKNVIFNDAGFENDNVKINAELTLKNHGVEDIKSL
jgi:adenine-specific DNA-methyltransferase